MLALYIGGMGAKGRNFYNDLARRYGYEQEAEQVQDLYLAGKKMEATGVSTLIVSTMDVNTVRTIAELAL
jgi:hypothetical protein